MDWKNTAYKYKDNLEANEFVISITNTLTQIEANWFSDCMALLTYTIILKMFVYRLIKNYVMYLGSSVRIQSILHNQRLQNMNMYDVKSLTINDYSTKVVFRGQIYYMVSNLQLKGHRDWKRHLRMKGKSVGQHSLGYIALTKQ